MRTSVLLPYLSFCSTDATECVTQHTQGSIFPQPKPAMCFLYLRYVLAFSLNGNLRTHLRSATRSPLCRLLYLRTEVCLWACFCSILYINIFPTRKTGTAQRSQRPTAVRIFNQSARPASFNARPHKCTCSCFSLSLSLSLSLSRIKSSLLFILNGLI